MQVAIWDFDKVYERQVCSFSRQPLYASTLFVFIDHLRGDISSGIELLKSAQQLVCSCKLLTK